MSEETNFTRPPDESPQGKPHLRYVIECDKALEKMNDTRMEFAKLHYDWLKHQTTLCTGSIVIISAVSGSVFAESSFIWGWLIPISIVSLFLAILLLILSMWYWMNRSERAIFSFYLQADEGHEVAEDLHRIEQVTEEAELTANRLGWLGSALFILGLVSLCAFALRNADGIF